MGKRAAAATAARTAEAARRRALDIKASRKRAGLAIERMEHDRGEKRDDDDELLTVELSMCI